jgi:hypothetical protein
MSSRDYLKHSTSSTQPPNPQIGDEWYDSANNVFYKFVVVSGTTPTWRTIGGGSGGAAAVTISNDITTSTNTFPLFSGTTSGTASAINTSSPRLRFVPSTGELTAQQVNADNGLIINNTNILNSYTIGAGYSAMSTGPVTLANNVTVTVSANSKWVIL